MASGGWNESMCERKHLSMPRADTPKDRTLVFQSVKWSLSLSGLWNWLQDIAG